MRVTRESEVRMNEIINKCFFIEYRRPTSLSAFQMITDRIAYDIGVLSGQGMTIDEIRSYKVKELVDHGINCKCSRFTLETIAAEASRVFDEVYESILRGRREAN